MKVLIIGFSKIKYMPYANFYLENIDTAVNDVHFLYWNRDLKPENISNFKNVTLHEFACLQMDDGSKISKIKNFVKYRKYATHLLKKEQFDFVIFLHSFPGVLLYQELTKKYSQRFIFDYRDSTYEYFPPFKHRIQKLVEYSKLTFVSSDAFRQLLPKDQTNKIITSHNLLLESLFHRNEKEKYGTVSDKIRIAFWGFIRDERINREIIKKIANNSRFELHYYGREQDIAINLKKYAADLDARNVYFHGEYSPCDRYVFVKSADLIHNIYNDKNMMMAMGNKYYDGLIFYIPQLCMQNSFMGKKCTTNKIGLECNPSDDDFLDKIEDYYLNLDKQEFKRQCDRELEKVVCEYNEGKAQCQTLFV